MSFPAKGSILVDLKEQSRLPVLSFVLLFESKQVAQPASPFLTLSFQRIWSVQKKDLKLAKGL